MSLQAYQKAQRNTEHPRDMEYRLFAQVTQALIAADKAGRADFPKLVDALDWNRRMWSVLAADCASDANQLPPALRAQIISLSLWVSRYSSDAVSSGAALEPLIEVNRAIMGGLGVRQGAQNPGTK